MKIRKIISALLAVTLLITALPVSPLLTVSAKNTPTVYKGVDVSRWNGDIDWSVMKECGIDFAIMRCYSVDTDKRFYEYYDAAFNEGIDIGAYVFMYATTNKEAIKEANDVLLTLKGRALTYPLFVDIEYEKLKSMDREYLTDLVITELEIFKKAGYEAGIYCSKNFQQSYLNMDRLSKYYIWTAKWSLYATESNGKKFYFKDIDPYDESKPKGDLWQFSNGGYGPHYGTQSYYLDLDYCYVDFKNKLSSTASKNPGDYTVPSRKLFYLSSDMMQGRDVAWVQAVLYQLGYSVSVDGIYSPATKTAVSEFQKNCGLAVSGEADAETVNMLSSVYAHKDFTATVKFNPDNSDKTVSAGKFSYGSAITVGNGLKPEKEGYYLGGWTLQRASDGKFYCTNGYWHTAAKIAEGKIKKRIFADGQKLNINDIFLKSENSTGDTFTFCAVWDTQMPPKYTVYKDETVYNVYYSSLSYSEAESFCAQRGAQLASFNSGDSLSALSVLKEGDKFFIGAKKESEEFVFTDGTKVSLPVSGESGEYLAVSSESVNEPYTLFAVSGAEDVNGFIMSSPCTHDKIVIENFKDTLCDKDGYSGDKVCGQCKAVLEKGSTVKCAGHAYGAYTVTKKATCKAEGVKERVCEVCGYSATTEIAKTNKHSFKTNVIKKATLTEYGKVQEKCTVCGLTEKARTVKKIKSVTLSADSAAYTGKKITPSVKVKDKGGETLVKGKDYSVSYKNNKYVGKATVTVTFKGKYSGTVKKTFKILPPATAFKSVTSKNKSVTLKWKRSSKQTTGYLIEYSPSKSFKKDVTKLRIKGNSTVSKTVYNLARGKTLYFRIRTYKSLSKTNYYSKYSKIFKVTIK